MENLTGKTIAILTEDGFEEIELTSPKKALEEAGADVKIISPKSGAVRAKEGDEWKEEYDVDVELRYASPNNYDGLFIPGGVIHPDKLRTNRDALAFIRAFFESGKPVAAICHGPQVLINAEVVEGRRMTSVDAIKIDLINAGS
ncbi:MAG TPA: type 1 glutamine amidotransferase domain-containing protein, partial [Sphingobacterium sp.]|nr:type 1 glutamine amidotransferase domain-containing protein [Sphingobacterium sp.]